MENLIVKLLEISRQLDDANLGEFDFGRLKSALSDFEQKAPEMLRVQAEERLLRSHLLAQITGKLRALKLARGEGCGGTSSSQDASMNDLDARRLMEINSRLSAELNAVFSSRPNFLKTRKNLKGVKEEGEFKI